jgi:DNA-directed RNA polymerase specialized sigma24 family protein
VKQAPIENTLLFEADQSDASLQMTLLKEQQLTALASAIGELKDEQRKAIEYFYLKDKSYDQIAIELKFPLKKVKSLIQNGKRNLKIILENKREFNEKIRSTLSNCTLIIRVS